MLIEAEGRSLSIIMEVPRELVVWLQSTQLFPSLVVSDSDVSAIPQTMLEQFSSAQGFHLLLTRLYALKVLFTQSLPQPEVQEINPTAQSLMERAQNWEIVKLLTEPLGLTLAPQTITDLAAGTHEAVIEFLTLIKESEPTTTPAQSPKKAPGVYLDTMDTDKALFQADSCIEFFILSFCSNFSLKPKQSAGLLTKNNEILARVIAKGLKGDFDPVVAWLQSIYQNTERLSDLLLNEKDKNSLLFVLPILKAGLLSKHSDVVQWTCKVFSRLAMDLEERGFLQEVWTWFVSAKGCLDLVISLYRKQMEDILPVAVEMMLHISQFNLIQLFSYHLKNLLQDPVSYFSFVHSILPVLKETEWIRDEVLSSRILNYWLESALREADAYTSQAKTTVLLFLVNLWTEFFSTLEETDTVLLLITGSLKNCFRDRQTLVRTTAVAVTMELLDYLIQEKHPKAMTLYQTLVLMLVEMDNAETGREVVICSVTRLVKSVNTLPVSLLVEPLVKRIHLDEPTYVIELTEFSLFAAIAEHSRLLLQDAIQLADLLGKMYMSVLLVSRAALPAFCMLIVRFIDTPAMQDYLALYCRYCLAEALSAESFLQSVRPKKGFRGVDEVEKLHIVSDMRVRDLAFEIIAWILQLQNETLNETLKQTLVAYELSYEENQGRQCKGLLILLAEFGDPQLLLRTAVPAEEEEPQEAPVQALVSTEQPQTDTESVTTGMEIVPAVESIQEAPKKLPFPWKRAFQDLKVAKEKAKRRLQRLTETSSELSNPTKPLKSKSIQGSLATPATTSRQIDSLLLARFIPKSEEFSFIDITSEEQRLIDGLFKRFARVLRGLFNTYTAVGFSRKRDVDSEFDWLANRKSVLPESGLIKLFTEYNIAPKLISKEEIRAGVKLYCAQVLKQPELKEVDYTGFLYCFTQFSLCVFSRDPYDYSHLHPFISVRSLLDTLRLQSKSLNQSTDFYDNPDPGHGDKDVVKQLTEEITRNPGISLPAGYIKIQDTDCKLVYQVPRVLDLPEAKCAALEVIDKIMYETFEVRILEANCEFYTVNRVYGVGQKKEHVALPPIYERRPSELKQKIKTHIEDTVSKDKPKRPNPLSPVIKLEIAKTTPENREIYQECGFLLNDLLHSVALNSSKVVQREEGKVKKMNSLLEDAAENEKFRGKSREKWRMRKAELDEKMKEIASLKEKQKAEDAEKAKKQKEMVEKKAKNLAEKLRKEKEERDRLFKDWFEQKEVKERQEREETQKQKSISDEKTRKLREELKRKMNEKLKEAIVKRHEEWKQRTEVAPSPTLVQELDRNKKQFSRIIQEDKKRLAEKERHQAEFREFERSPEVTAVHTKYKKHLELLFSLYCKQSLARVEFDPTTFFNQMTLIEFSKLCSQFGITPVLVSADVILNIFNSLTKMKLREAGVPATITYDEFLTALLRVTDQATAYLNKVGSVESAGLRAETYESLCKWMGMEVTVKEFHEKVKKLQAEKKHHHRRLRSSGVELAPSD